MSETYWKEVDQTAHYLIADLLNQKLPLPNLRKKENLNLAQDADYRTISASYADHYEGEELPSIKDLAESITYEYLLEVVKSILLSLRDFSCHSEEYLANIF